MSFIAAFANEIMVAFVKVAMPAAIFAGGLAMARRPEEFVRYFKKLRNDPRWKWKWRWYGTSAKEPSENDYQVVVRGMGLMLAMVGLTGVLLHFLKVVDIIP